MCKTCIFRPELHWDLEKLLCQIIDGHGFFNGWRICHHSEDVCCRGFWEAHKDDFAEGQIAQRLNLVEFVHVDNGGA